MIAAAGTPLSSTEWRSLYLVPEIADQDAVAGGVVSRHGRRSAACDHGGALRVGEHVAVGDGARAHRRGDRRLDRRRRARASPSSADPPRGAPRPELWLAQALAKGDRDELAVQAATELGVEGVIPWAGGAQRLALGGREGGEGPRPLGEHRARGGKQAIRAWVPEVAALATTADLAALPRPRPRSRAHRIRSPHRRRARRPRPHHRSSSDPRAGSRRTNWRSFATHGAPRARGAAHLDRRPGRPRGR